MLNTKALAASVSAVAAKVYVEDVFNTFLYTGNGSTQTITNGIALGEEVAIAPGTALGGGFFAGFISHTDDGIATHALIVAPAASGYNGQVALAWKTTNTSTAGTTSPFNGAINSANMNNASHPAAQYCEGLSIGGYSDWYLPARYELDIAYENLKPTTTSNNTSWGINPYSVPERTVNRTAGAPARTSIAAFQTGGAEAFVAGSHWSSTEGPATDNAWFLLFSDGFQFTDSKTATIRVRAFRKVPISDPLLDQYRVTGKGGLVWLKSRSVATDHQLFDTARGATKELISNSNAIQATDADTLTAFNGDGFSLGADSNTNTSSATYASWTFRKAAKFFDVVTYTGNGVSPQTINHNLGSTPGCIIVKRTDTTENWLVYHRSVTNGYLVLNATSATSTRTDYIYQNPTSTTFQVGFAANASGGTYVAYLFAHDAGGFGDAGTANVVSCGSYTGNGSASGPTVTLGWEPQWLLVKRASGGTGDWALVDTMRGFGVSTNVSLEPNSASAESTATDFVGVRATGFGLLTTDPEYNGSGNTYIYIAIRRGPMKTPTDATKVFNLLTQTGTGAVTSLSSGFPLDMVMSRQRFYAGGFCSVVDRLRGVSSAGAGTGLLTQSTQNEAGSYANEYVSFNQAGITVGTGTNQLGNATNAFTMLYHFFRRAPGFFDVVAYTGTGSARTVSHNLSVVPELMIVKARGTAGYDWLVYHPAMGNTKYIQLNYGVTAITQIAVWNSTTPTSSVFSLGNWESNTNGITYIAYLFATLSGVSKVGSYTGTGTTLNIDCGFTAGARFVLIKRTDSTGDWFVWDTARGIISGNDPYLLLNSTAAEVTNTDYIDPLSSGFQISSTAPAAINANGGSFVFLAIA